MAVIITYYAQESDLIDYAPEITAQSNTMNALIRDAEWDIDSIFAGRPIITGPVGSPAIGYRFDLSATSPLSATKKLGLLRATCAQAQFRNRMGPDFFVVPPFTKVKGPDFTTESAPPRVGAKTRRELLRGGLISAQARSRP